MRPSEVLKLFQKRPFVPLLIRMVGGTLYRVNHPECTITERCIAIPVEEGDIEVAAIEYIEAIRPLQRSNQAGGKNGNGRRKR